LVDGIGGLLAGTGLGQLWNTPKQGDTLAECRVLLFEAVDIGRDVAHLVCVSVFKSECVRDGALVGLKFVNRAWVVHDFASFQVSRDGS